MSTQSEAILEENLLKQLVSLGYEKVLIRDEAELLANLKAQLEKQKENSATNIDIEVEDIDTKELLEAPDRLKTTLSPTTTERRTHESLRQ